MGSDYQCRRDSGADVMNQKSAQIVAALIIGTILNVVLKNADLNMRARRNKTDKIIDNG